MANFPRPEEGIVITHFIVTSDIDRSRRFYAGVLGGEVLLNGQAGFHRALLACAVFLLAAAVIALRATNSHGEPVTQPSHTPAVRDQVPAPELTD